MGRIFPGNITKGKKRKHKMRQRKTEKDPNGTLDMDVREKHSYGDLD